MIEGSTHNHVLIVEDSQTHLELILDALGSQFQTVCAATLAEALNILQSFRPDIILADLFLPDGKSLDLLPRTNGGFNCPVIIISGQGDEGIAVESIKAGAFDYLVKSPENLQALPAILKRTLREWDHITERKKAENALQERTRIASVGAEAGLALTRETDQGLALKRCTDALVQHLEVAFARIWLYDPTEGLLVLKASSGLYTHLDGPHSRIPLGKMKVGQIAAQRHPQLCNNIIGDPQIEHQDWAAENNLTSFAGYPLIRGEKLIGVMAAFSRTTMAPSIFEGLSCIADAMAIGIERFHFEAAMSKANRNLKALSACNALLVQARDEKELLGDVCRIIGEIGGYSFVWAGYAEQEEPRRVTPAASFGPHQDYLESIHITWGNDPLGKGPTGTAIRTGKPCICGDMSLSASFSPWRDLARQKGFAASIALPIMAAQGPLGALNIYSNRKNAFDAEEIALLTDLANNLSVGILALRNNAKKEHLQTLLEKALVDAEQGRNRIDAVIQSITDGMLVTDRTNRVILLNEAAENLLGKPSAGILGEPVASSLCCPEVVQAIDKTLIKGTVSDPLDWQPATGTQALKTFQVTTSPARAKDGHQFGTITIFRDVSHEREIDQLKNQFISTAAHELKTPLTSVIGYAELLINAEEFAISDKEQKKEFLHYICDKALCLSGIVDDLLDLSRIQSGRKIPLNPVDSDISQLISKTAAPYTHITPQHRFLIHLPSTPVSLHIDPVRIEQVMENILSNAVKYSPSGGTITICGSVEQDHFRVSVSDEGIGMTQQQAERIFDYFYRVDSSNTAVGGLGLGMAIAKNIVAAHGGDIRVKSEPARGTTIHFTLPLPKAVSA